MLTNDIVSFEQLGPDLHNINAHTKPSENLLIFTQVVVVSFVVVFFFFFFFFFVVIDALKLQIKRCHMTTTCGYFKMTMHPDRCKCHMCVFILADFLNKFQINILKERFIYFLLSNKSAVGNPLLYAKT